MCIWVCVEEGKGRGSSGHKGYRELQKRGQRRASSREERRGGGRQIRGSLYCGVDESKCVRWPASGLCVSVWWSSTEESTVNHSHTRTHICTDVCMQTAEVK